jgi:hypothetical protein
MTVSQAVTLVHVHVAWADELGSGHRASSIQGTADLGGSNSPHFAVRRRRGRRKCLGANRRNCRSGCACVCRRDYKRVH